MNPVHIDLVNLDDAKLAEAMPHMSQCKYSAPCIIGTLFTPDQRHHFDILNVNTGELDEVDTANLGSLLNKGYVTMPADQVTYAKDLQRAFDGEDHAQVDEVYAQIRSRFHA